MWRDIAVPGAVCTIGLEQVATTAVISLTTALVPMTGGALVRPTGEIRYSPAMHAPPIDGVDGGAVQRRHDSEHRQRELSHAGRTSLFLHINQRSAGRGDVVPYTNGVPGKKSSRWVIPTSTRQYLPGKKGIHW